MKNKVIRSYAKINLGLNVVSKREDGYHELDMVMLPIELHDSLLFSELKNSDTNFVTLDDFAFGDSHYNLITQAINKLCSIYHFNNRFRISMHKVIPIQAGLGGGSSNAAFILKEVRDYLKLPISNEKLKEIGATLGADIPFFIDCKPMRVQGIGEKLTPISVKENYYVLIIKPHHGCSTQKVFNLSDTLILDTVNIPLIIKGLEEGNDDLIAENIGNSLTKAAIEFVPDIENIIISLKNDGLKIVSMTGSGSAVFALSRDKKQLRKIAKKYEERYIVEITKIIK